MTFFRERLWERKRRTKEGAWRYSHRFAFTWRQLKFWNNKNWAEIKQHLKHRKELGYNVIPSSFAKMFRPLLETPFKDVRIVIVGQDHYIKPGLSDGLIFSVMPNVKKLPRPLCNIFREYVDDLKFPYPRTGDLSYWARKGILLIPTIWSIEEGAKRISLNYKANNSNHYRINGKFLWQDLTVEILEVLSKKKDKLVFIFWGKKAQEYAYMVDTKKHLVLKGAHPSPRNFTKRSDFEPFLGGRYFSKACEYLDISPNIWRLP